jgi:hypothetical protein
MTEDLNEVEVARLVITTMFNCEIEQEEEVAIERGQAGIVRLGEGEVVAFLAGGLLPEPTPELVEEFGDRIRIVPMLDLIEGNLMRWYAV